MKHIVSYSGGLGSWMAAKRVIEKYGTEDVYLVFTDTLIEDEDLYRFLFESSNSLGVAITRLSDGRDPWQVFEDVKYAGNTRIAHCSKELKSKVFEKWIKEQDFDDFIVYLGIDWTEEHRLVNHRKHVDWQVEAPLCEAPFLTQKQLREALVETGIKLPKLYEMGFSQNNCSGGGVKAGQGQWALVHKEMPEKYKEFEEKQERLFKKLPKAKPFLRITINKELNYVSLKDYRKKFLEKNVQIDMFDIGGCGCFVDE